MKTNLFIEHNGKKVLEKDLINLAKDIWRKDGNLIKKLTKLELYFKPEEHVCYYVFNDEKSGSFNVD